MVASHSIRSVAKELANMSANSDFIAINFIGKQSTGKTEAMYTTAHLIHKFANFPYKVNYFGRKQMLNLEETVKNLTPTNQIIIMDDIAFLNAEATTTQIKQIEYIMSVIRHLPGGKDVKIILMKSFQYTKALPPFLRQNNATFISSVDDNEIESLETMVGKKHTQKIHLLKKMRAQAMLGGDNESYFTYPLGFHGQKVVYKTKDPFLPFLYHNQISCRFVVSPLRTWIDPICPVCDTAGGLESKKNLQEFLYGFVDKNGKKHSGFISKFGDKYVAQTAIRIKLLQMGINCFSANITNAVTYIDKYLEQKLFNIQELAAAFELEPTRTILQKKVEVNKET